MRLKERGVLRAVSGPPADPHAAALRKATVLTASDTRDNERSPVTTSPKGQSPIATPATPLPTQPHETGSSTSRPERIMTCLSTSQASKRGNDPTCTWLNQETRAPPIGARVPPSRTGRLVLGEDRGGERVLGVRIPFPGSAAHHENNGDAQERKGSRRGSDRGATNTKGRHKGEVCNHRNAKRDCTCRQQAKILMPRIQRIQRGVSETPNRDRPLGRRSRGSVRCRRR